MTRITAPVVYTAGPLASLLGAVVREPWMARAACLDEDPEVFFQTDSRGGIDAAKAVCRRCPVMVACAMWAVARPWEEGVWGCLTRDERKSLVRSRKRAGTGRRELLGDDFEHGTARGYRDHLHRQVPVCQECLDAETTRTRSPRRLADRPAPAAARRTP